MTEPLESGASGGGLIGDSAVLMARNLTLFRNPASAMGMIMFPLIFPFGFLVVLTRSLDAIGVSAVQMLPPTVVVQATFFAAISSAFYLAADRTSGLIARLRTLPIHPAATIVGRLAADAIRSLISSGAVLLAATILGFRFRAGFGAMVGFVALTALLSVTLAAGFGAWSLAARDATAATQVMSVPYLPLLMLSTGFSTVAGFPGWLQPFVRWQPVSLAVDALRVLAEGGPTAGPVLKAVIVLAALCIAFVFLGARAFRRLT